MSWKVCVGSELSCCGPLVKMSILLHVCFFLNVCPLCFVLEKDMMVVACCVLWSLLLAEIIQSKSLFSVVTSSYPPTMSYSVQVARFCCQGLLPDGSVFGFQTLRCDLGPKSLVFRIGANNCLSCTSALCFFLLSLVKRIFFHSSWASLYYQRGIFQPFIWATSISGAESRGRVP